MTASLLSITEPDLFSTADNGSSSPFARRWEGEPAVDADAGTGPRFVSRRLVHKTSPGQVVLTDGIRLARDRFLVAALVPHVQGLYRQDNAGRFDPMLLLEALRQTGYYISHRFYGVPGTHAFVLGGVTLRVGQTSALVSDEPWLPVNLHVTCIPTAKWTRRRLGMRLEVELSIAGRMCGHGSLISEAVDERIYHVIRRRSATAGGPPLPEYSKLLPCRAVGRPDPADVVLADPDPAGGWLLRVDQDHPGMFDHPVDHVPGMVLVEAFRQAAFTTAAPLAGGGGVVMSEMRTEFQRFCELDTATRITATALPAGPGAGRALVQVAAEQNGARVATGTVELCMDKPGAETDR